MLTKTDAAEIGSYLSDASNMAGGRASGVVFPESAEEAAGALAEAAREGVPVTVAGAGTGVVGGRVPFGGVVLATERLNYVKEIVREGEGGWATAGAGITLADFRRAVEAEGLFYPPDPTEWSCYLGGTVATNASGARTFKYGPTRRYVRRLRVALTTGDVIDLRRGQFRADWRGRLRIPLGGAREIDARLPGYRMPRTTKHAAGYYVEPGADAVDLFVGSEGTLGVVCEVEVSLLPKPRGLLSGVVFFREEPDLLEFVRAARRTSRHKQEAGIRGGFEARALEYFDRHSLDFLRAKYPSLPAAAAGAVFFEQETDERSEETLAAAWLALCERCRALSDDSWFAADERDQARLREFRHALPVLVNEWLARRGQRKVSTDMAVPDAAFPAMLAFYQDSLREANLAHVVFGHIGDNHVHVNILPRDDLEAARARALYLQFVRRAVSLGGTISAEHGVGKLKRDYLRELYGDEHLRQMADLKRAFDPALVLGRGNMFAEEYL